MERKKARVGLRYKNKIFFLNVRKCSGLDEGFGLMFTRRKNAEALLFDFSGRKRPALHSLFVFFPFLAVWLDDKNKVIEKRIVKSFSFSVFSRKEFSRIVEIPSSKKYHKIIEKLDGRERFK